MRSFLLATLLALTAAAQALEPGFTYQGRLLDGNSPVTGAFEFEFELYDDVTTGASLAGPLTVGPVQVQAGLFTVEIDFGFNPFAGLDSWLEVRVRPGVGGEPFETLLPRQRMAPAPNALHAESVALGSVGSLQLAEGAVTPASLAPGAVGTAALANAAVSTTKLADGAVTGAKANLNQIQARIASGCPPGQAIRVVQGFGEVLCQDAPQVDLRRFTRSRNMVLSGAVSLGERVGFAIDPAGRPFVSVYESIQGNLIAIHCDVPDCSSFQVNTVDADGIVGDYSSVAFRPGDGRPMISYWSQTLNALRLATCGDASCSTVTSIVTVDSGNVGQWTQLILAEGAAYIAYHDYGQSRLKLARVENLGTGTPTIRVASSGSGDGTHTNMTLAPVAGGNDLWIVHGNSAQHSLRLTRCSRTSNNICPTAIIDTGTASVPLGRGNAVVLGPNGYPAIITNRPNENGTLSGVRLFICANVSCTQHETIDRENCANCGSLTRPLLWRGMDGALGFTAATGAAHRCFDNDCSVINFALNSGLAAGHLRLAVQIGPDGMPWILSRVSNAGVSLRRCGNRFCTEYGDGRY